MVTTQHAKPRATNDQLKKKLKQLNTQTASMRKLEIKTKKCINAVQKEIKNNWRMHPVYVRKMSDKLLLLEDQLEHTYGNRRQTEGFMEDMEKELKEENSTSTVTRTGKVNRNIRYNAYAHPYYERKYVEKAHTKQSNMTSDEKKEWEKKIDEAMEEYYSENWKLYESGYNMSFDWEHEP